MTPEEEHRYWRQHFDARLEKLEAAITTAIAELKQTAVEGFPNGDAPGHRKVHEGYIKAAEAKQKIKTEVLTHTLKGAAWAAVVFVALAIWNQFKLGLK